MGRPVLHRGECQQVWSPAPKVYFGQAEHRQFDVTSGSIASDWHVRGSGHAMTELFGRMGTAPSPPCAAPSRSRSATAPGG